MHSSVTCGHLGWLPCTHSCCAGLPPANSVQFQHPSVHRGIFELIAFLWAPLAANFWVWHLDLAGRSVPTKRQMAAAVAGVPAGETCWLLQSNKGRGNEGMAEMRQAYEFTLDHIGQDFRAGDLWREYIAFVAGPGPGTPAYQALWGDAARPGQESSERLRVLRWGACLGVSLHMGVLGGKEVSQTGQLTWRCMGLQLVVGICAGSTSLICLGPASNTVSILT